MFESLKNIGLNLNDKICADIEDYISFFFERNQRINLVSSNDASVLFEKHIYDSLAYNLFVQKYNIPSDKEIKIADIGTGGGFPAVPLSFVYKNAHIYAFDSVNKKINFIKEVKEKYKLDNLNPVCSRFEDLSSSYKNFFDVALSRAVAELPVILEYSMPFVKKGGYFCAYKSVKAEAELNSAKNALKVLKTELIDTVEYNLPLDGINKRVLLIFKKKGNIPSEFPRKNGIPKKNPL